MIHEIDEALRGLVSDEVLAGSGVEVTFDAPTREWAARRNAPTVNLFLYDICEDMARRRQGSITEYDEQGVTVARHDPPRFYTLSYIVTAWTSRTQDEHRLLSVLLASLIQQDALPAERLAGSLAALGLTIPMTIAVPVPDRALADVWSALGGELKPSLDLVVVAPLSAKRVLADPVVVDGMRLRIADSDGGREETSALRYTDPVAGGNITDGQGSDTRDPDSRDPDSRGPLATVGTRRTRGTPQDRRDTHDPGFPISGRRR